MTTNISRMSFPVSVKRRPLPEKLGHAGLVEVPEVAGSSLLRQRHQAADRRVDGDPVDAGDALERLRRKPPHVGHRHEAAQADADEHRGPS